MAVTVSLDQWGRKVLKAKKVTSVKKVTQVKLAKLDLSDPQDLKEILEWLVQKAIKVTSDRVVREVNPELQVRPVPQDQKVIQV
jgi:hypothetical protein